MLTHETGAVIKVIPVDDAGQLLLDDYTALLDSPWRRCQCTVTMITAGGN
jgi:cysteine desulfurase/selenocysteine lyase